MHIHSYDTPIIMNEAHLHWGFCDYHLCAWGGKPAPVCLGSDGVFPWMQKSQWKVQVSLVQPH